MSSWVCHAAGLPVEEVSRQLVQVLGRGCRPPGWALPSWAEAAELVAVHGHAVQDSQGGTWDLGDFRARTIDSVGRGLARGTLGLGSGSVTDMVTPKLRLDSMRVSGGPAHALLLPDLTEVLGDLGSNLCVYAADGPPGLQLVPPRPGAAAAAAGAASAGDGHSEAKRSSLGTGGPVVTAASRVYSPKVSTAKDIMDKRRVKTKNPDYFCLVVPCCRLSLGRTTDMDEPNIDTGQWPHFVSAVVVGGRVDGVIIPRGAAGGPPSACPSSPGAEGSPAKVPQLTTWRSSSGERLTLDFHGVPVPGPKGMTSKSHTVKQLLEYLDDAWVTKVRAFPVAWSLLWIETLETEAVLRELRCEVAPGTGRCPACRASLLCVPRGDPHAPRSAGNSQDAGLARVVSSPDPGDSSRVTACVSGLPGEPRDDAKVVAFEQGLLPCGRCGAAFRRTGHALVCPNFGSRCFHFRPICSECRIILARMVQMLSRQSNVLASDVGEVGSDASESEAGDPASTLGRRSSVPESLLKVAVAAAPAASPTDSRRPSMSLAPEVQSRTLEAARLRLASSASSSDHLPPSGDRSRLCSSADLADPSPLPCESSDPMLPLGDGSNLSLPLPSPYDAGAGLHPGSPPRAEASGSPVATTLSPPPVDEGSQLPGGFEEPPAGASNTAAAAAEQRAGSPSCDVAVVVPGDGQAAPPPPPQAGRTTSKRDPTILTEASKGITGAGEEAQKDDDREVCLAAEIELQLSISGVPQHRHTVYVEQLVDELRRILGIPKNQIIILQDHDSLAGIIQLGLLHPALVNARLYDGEPSTVEDYIITEFDKPAEDLNRLWHRLALVVAGDAGRHRLGNSGAFELLSRVQARSLKWRSAIVAPVSECKRLVNNLRRIQEARITMADFGGSEEEGSEQVAVPVKLRRRSSTAVTPARDSAERRGSGSGEAGSPAGGSALLGGAAAAGGASGAAAPVGGSPPRSPGRPVRRRQSHSEVWMGTGAGCFGATLGGHIVKIRVRGSKLKQPPLQMLLADDLASFEDAQERAFKDKATGPVGAAAAARPPHREQEDVWAAAAEVLARPPATEVAAARHLELHRLIWQGDFEGVKAAIARSDVRQLNEPDRHGRRPLHVAASHGSLALLALFTSMCDTCGPVRFDVRDVKGRTPLHYCALRGDEEVAALLVAVASLGQLDVAEPRVGETAIHFAARAGRSALVQVLLDARASAQVTNLHGSTPLHYAAAAGDVESCKLLLASGASPKVKDNVGRTARRWALQHQNPDAAALLDADDSEEEWLAEEAAAERRRRSQAVALALDTTAVSRLAASGRGGASTRSAGTRGPLAWDSPMWRAPGSAPPASGGRTAGRRGADPCRRPATSGPGGGGTAWGHTEGGQLTKVGTTRASPPASVGGWHSARSGRGGGSAAVVSAAGGRTAAAELTLPPGSARQAGRPPVGTGAERGAGGRTDEGLPPLAVGLSPELPGGEDDVPAMGRTWPGNVASLHVRWRGWAQTALLEPASRAAALAQRQADFGQAAPAAPVAGCRCAEGPEGAAQAAAPRRPLMSPTVPLRVSTAERACGTEASNKYVAELSRALGGSFCTRCWEYVLDGHLSP